MIQIQIIPKMGQQMALTRSLTAQMEVKAIRQTPMQTAQIIQVVLLIAQIRTKPIPLTLRIPQQTPTAHNLTILHLPQIQPQTKIVQLRTGQQVADDLFQFWKE
jgi:hypothetical protein